jgi:hypothetical protein
VKAVIFDFAGTLPRACTTAGSQACTTATSRSTNITLEADELDRLGAVARARPLILSAWSVCTGRTTPTEAMTAASETKALTDLIATRIRTALTGR